MYFSEMRVLLVAACCFFAAAGVAQTPPPSPLILGVHPYLPVTEIQGRFTPLAERIEKLLGRKVEIRVGANYQLHIEAVVRDEVDIAFLGPVPFVRVLQSGRPKPLLARYEVDGQPYLFGVIIAVKASSLHTLSDLAGKRIAFGDRESTMSHIVPRWMLQEAGVPVQALAQYRFLGSHKNVALAVLAGDADAGAVKREIFEEYAAQGLKALATTTPTADHLFVTRSTFPVAEAARLREMLLSLHLTTEGKLVLASLQHGLTSLLPVAESDYANLRSILRDLKLEED